MEVFGDVDVVQKASGRDWFLENSRDVAESPRTFCNMAGTSRGFGNMTRVSRSFDNMAGVSKGF